MDAHINSEPEEVPGKLKPTLQLMASTPNRMQGTRYGQLVSACDLPTGQRPPDGVERNSTGGDEFLFVPIPRGAYFVATTWVCQ